MSSNGNNKGNSSESILIELMTDNGVLRLTLNDSKRRNALSEEMMTSIATALSKAEKNTDVKVIIISANGPAFCSGHDLSLIHI